MENQEKKKEEIQAFKGEKEVYQGVGSFIFEVIKIVLLAFIIFAPIRFLVFQPFFVQGSSMEPNFENNEYLIINEVGYKKISLGKNGKYLEIGPFRKMERGQAVVFRYPKNKNQYFIKRVIALPGERIEIKNSQVFIFNEEFSEGFLLDEKEYLSSYVETTGDLNMTLDENEYFVMGDNRMFSSDSRSWGAVREKDIIGRVLLRAWPLNRLEIF